VLCCVIAERSAGDQVARGVKRYDNHTTSNDAFLPTLVVVMVVVTGLASLALLAFAVHRRQLAGALQPPCSRTTKAAPGGTAPGVVIGGQTSESLGLLPQPSCEPNRPSPAVRAAELVVRGHQSSTFQGPSNFSALPYTLPVWAVPPPPAPPPSCAADDAVSELASTFAVFPSTDNDYDYYDDDDDELRTASTCWPATSHRRL